MSNLIAYRVFRSSSVGKLVVGIAKPEQCLDGVSEGNWRCLTNLTGIRDTDIIAEDGDEYTHAAFDSVSAFENVFPVNIKASLADYWDDLSWQEGISIDSFFPTKLSCLGYELPYRVFKEVEPLIVPSLSLPRTLDFEVKRELCSYEPILKRLFRYRQSDGIFDVEVLFFTPQEIAPDAWRCDIEVVGWPYPLGLRMLNDKICGYDPIDAIFLKIDLMRIIFEPYRDNLTWINSEGESWGQRGLPRYLPNFLSSEQIKAVLSMSRELEGRAVEEHYEKNPDRPLGREENERLL